MLGLTGGIGAGKSTVSAMLAELGAATIDTDAIAREVTEPGGAAHDAVVRRFGSADRRHLADVAFTSLEARADLNRIVHPAVEAGVRERLAAEQAKGTEVVVVQVPLLVEAGWGRLVSTVVVVDCPVDLAVERLVQRRGMPVDDARRRVAAQASRDERLAAADIVLHNDGALDDLQAQVTALWADLRTGV